MWPPFLRWKAPLPAPLVGVSAAHSLPRDFAQDRFDLASPWPSTASCRVASHATRAARAASRMPTFSAKASASSGCSGECWRRVVFFVLVFTVMVHLCSVVYSLNRVSIIGGQDQNAAPRADALLFRLNPQNLNPQNLNQQNLNKKSHSQRQQHTDKERTRVNSQQRLGCYLQRATPSNRPILQRLGELLFAACLPR